MDNIRITIEMIEDMIEQEKKNHALTIHNLDELRNKLQKERETNE